jgi:glycosyltransferase involved in cell wall biosynthesis
MCKYAKRNAISYVISPRGMLEPWALEQSRFKKLLAMFIYQYSDLKKAACLHATSKKESSNYRKLGLTNPVAIIPNGIDLSQINPIKIPTNGYKNKLLFLSRIHNGKGLENLLLAWKNIPEYLKSSWTLEVVGDGEESYVQSLINQIENLNIKDQVKFIGPLYNEEKINAFQSSDIFVLPTYSENFGMAIAEAMAFGLPVITTKGAPWEELETHHAGWWIEIGVEPLTQALIEAMSTHPSKLIEMGKNGRKLIEDKYSIESVAKQMTELYEWILQKRDKPDFVI